MWKQILWIKGMCTKMFATFLYHGELNINLLIHYVFQTIQINEFDLLINAFVYGLTSQHNENL